ncbi:DUF4411 family protein [Staphylococcus simulans]|uniref:DUF4411 family protein n=1 Tax=Staphylococcus simulans TaxID=1286 RepID=UPI000CD028BF|nr:DUF4411 family protein [Staphylococcus simulans]PNZ41435.1 DUF4411 domain-containing protein [Staphylococcus simulans]SQE73101.1 Uncharacterised protein [Staphylococcus simulans]VED59200.1 Uncharacterised protein [Staphylococcus simulans]
MKKYILDSNIYINFYDRYYKYDYFPSFWKNLPSILNKQVIIPNIVLKENYQDPWFKKWLTNNYSCETLNHSDYFDEWQFILTHIQESDFYKNDAISGMGKGWGDVSIADPWLIAIAKREGYTIVTNENRSVNLSTSQPSKASKIPDICDDLNIECIDMNQCFKEISLSI